jgi:hypothetical protein
MQAVETKRARQIRLRTVLIVIAFLAMALALVVQSFKTVREERLRAQVALARARAVRAEAVNALLGAAKGPVQPPAASTLAPGSTDSVKPPLAR